MFQRRTLILLFGFLLAPLFAFCLCVYAETPDKEPSDPSTGDESVSESGVQEAPVPDDSEPAVVSPGISAYYQDADMEGWPGIFDRPSREVFYKRFEILKAIGVYPGMTVADVGAGTGYYTVLFARAVGHYGKVYAVDIADGFVAGIERRVAEYHVDNVEAVVNDQKDTRLPADSMDLVFLCNTYHNFEYPRSMLGSIARALKEDGELVLIDFRRLQGASSPWVMKHVRANQEEVMKELEEAGFALLEELDLLQENYVLRFIKAPPENDGDQRETASGSTTPASESVAAPLDDEPE